MTNSPFFSIVIPTYNRAGFIRKTIESVLVQTFQNLEIIVVDDGSTDDTETVVNDIGSPKLRYHKRENAERAAARNYGAKIAVGQYINFLDSDDVLYPNHLTVAEAFIKKHDRVDVFHLGYDIKDEKGEFLKSVVTINAINNRILSGNMLSCNGVFIRKEIALENPFKEDRILSSLEDWELWIRLSARHPFLNDNTITSTVVQHDNRSVMTTDTSKIKKKVDCFLHYVLQDEVNKKQYGAALNRTEASALTYASLHLAIAHENKFEVLRYLVKGVMRNPGEAFKKRCLVILKKLAGL